MYYNFERYTYILQSSPKQDYTQFKCYKRLWNFYDPLNLSVEWLPYIGKERRRKLEIFEIITIRQLFNKMKECNGPNFFHYWLLGAFGIQNNSNDVTVFSIITTLMDLYYRGF